MKRVYALASIVLLTSVATWLALAGPRGASSARPVADPPAPSSASIDEPDRLTTRIGARLDEIGQVEDDLSDQRTAVAKAETALAAARRDAEIADLAIREYDEGTYPQELALAEGELALAEADYRLADDPSRRSESPPKPQPPDADRSETKTPTNPDAQALARAKLTRDLARLHRDSLIRLTRPRKRAEFQKEVDRARAELLVKQKALAQEQTDLARLDRQLKDAALSAEERQALSLCEEVGKLAGGHPTPDQLERASALWAKAEHQRAEKLQADALERISKALGKPR